MYSLFTALLTSWFIVGEVKFESPVHEAYVRRQNDMDVAPKPDDDERSDIDTIRYLMDY